MSLVRQSARGLPLFSAFLKRSGAEHRALWILVRLVDFADLNPNVAADVEIDVLAAGCSEDLVDRSFVGLYPFDHTETTGMLIYSMGRSSANAGVPIAPSPLLSDVSNPNGLPHSRGSASAQRLC